MSKTVKVNLVVDTGFVGGDYIEEYDTELSREEWGSMSEDEKNDLLGEALSGFRDDCISVYFKEISNEN